VFFSFDKARWFTLTAFDPLATLQFELSAKDSLLNSVLPKVDRWQIFHRGIIIVWRALFAGNGINLMHTIQIANNYLLISENKFHQFNKISLTTHQTL